MQVHQMRAHLEDHHRRRQGDADPEAAGHVGEFRIRARLGGHRQRLERHAADRARARTDLADLRMHRASVDRPFGNRLGHCGLLAQKSGWVRQEPFPAADRAEVVGPAAVLGAMLRGVRIDVHAADQVFSESGRLRMVTGLGSA